MKKQVFVANGDFGYYRPFEQFGEIAKHHSILHYPEKISLVVFTGGADISPQLYNEETARRTYCILKRDIYELMLFRLALKNNLPIVGICRGAQFLCAMAGGKLYQHVTGHHTHHAMRTYDNRKFIVSSTHHQMQCPPKGAVILAWSETRLSNTYIGGDDKEMEPPEKECECAWYPNIRAVGIQYHPEMMEQKSQGFRYAAEIVKKFLL